MRHSGGGGGGGGHGVYGPSDGGGGGKRHRGGGGGGHPGNKPFFETVPFDEETGEGGRNVTAVEGGRAVLVCVVRNLGQNMTVRK